MSEQATENAETSEQEQPQEGSEKQQAPKTFDADYVAKLRKEAAQYRTEAKANADAAKKLSEIEESNKTEVQKATDRLVAAERERDEARVDSLRFKIAVKHGISEEDADLFLTGRDEDALTRQAERLEQREAQRQEAAEAAETERKKQGNHVPREGATSTAVNNSDHEFVSQLFSG